MKLEIVIGKTSQWLGPIPMQPPVLVVATCTVQQVKYLNLTYLKHPRFSISMQLTLVLTDVGIPLLLGKFLVQVPLSG